jgi:hypothetical protein
VPEQPLQPHSVPKGLLELEPSRNSSVTATQSEDVPMSANQSSYLTPPTFSQRPTPDQSNSTQTVQILEKPPADSQFVSSSHHHPSQAEILARARVATMIATARPATAQRKARTCRKCAKPECPGRQKVGNCLNVCRDCKRVNCQGRNSKRPNQTCAEGWL